MKHLEVVEQAIDLATGNGGFKTAQDASAVFQHLQAHKQEFEALKAENKRLTKENESLKPKATAKK
ncbi:hypothetical protein QO206_13355 [Leeuwenhoekiella aequorea]|uniref:hypothetical protein n=1 Tax=Leeuwenhoekiella aequorea TaxID=283736 RepID=UPI00352D3A03|tara:strand:+ start:34146 stop:34343 length:198 start_codon:yes stop_codon:yes gene_type:complete